MIDVQIVENGSINHPFYVKIYVDSLFVADKSFKSMAAAAEKGKERFVEETLVEMTRKLRSFSKAWEGLQDSVIDYPEKEYVFRGTGNDH
jgi:hypothetical protein